MWMCKARCGTWFEHGHESVSATEHLYQARGEFYSFFFPLLFEEAVKQSGELKKTPWK